jgi:hypothetical protein
MPIFRTSDRIVYYAHIPKCGGSAVETYLMDRFDRAGFLDHHHLDQPEARRWTRTSPQHVDVASLDRLFPRGFFDAVFTIVRHPVSRIVSAYHFQREVEKTVPADCGFGEWLDDVEEFLVQQPFAFDNHIRPMADLVPDGAEVMYLEHGLDVLVPWCDRVLGRRDGPRFVPQVNTRNEYAKGTGERVKPDTAELDRIARIYAVDFARFGYTVGERLPKAPAPELSAADLAAAEAARAAEQAPMRRLGRLVRKVAQKAGWRGN